MERQPVKSSNIAAVGYEDGVMEVEFTNGKVYRYTGDRVREHYDGMMAAPSIGAYFHAHVKTCPHTTCEKL